MTGVNKFALFLLLLLLCSGASASLLVSVSPKDPGMQTLTLYLDEVGDYQVVVFNDGPERADDVVVKVSAVEGLKIIESGAEKSAVSMQIGSVGPDEKETILLKLKPVEQSTKQLFLYVDYGIGSYTHLSATYLSVMETPLQINAHLSKTALDMGEEASVSLSLKNSGPEHLRNIRAELIVFDSLESMNGVVELTSLTPGEGYEAKEFLFRADPASTGKKQLVMQVSFEDSLGRHLIEKNFFVEIQSRQEIIYLIIGVIILLIVVAVLSRKKASGPAAKLEKPIVEEIEGEKVKTGE